MPKRNIEQQSEPGTAVPSFRRELGTRLSSVLTSFGTKKFAAKVAGVTPEQLSAYVAGRAKPPLEVVARLAEAAQVSLDWLTSGREPMRLASRTVGELTGFIRPLTRPLGEGEPSATGLVQIPVYDARASAGPGAFADQDLVIDHLALGEGWIRDTLRADPGRLLAVTAAGDSMSPTIESGDYLLVERAVDRLSDGAVYIVVRGGAVIVKRVRTAGLRAFLLQGDNPRATEERVGPDDPEETQIVGRVRAVLRIT